jgi:hypothetical protein
MLLMREPPKQRFSPGRRVLVGIGMRPATVKSVDDVPREMGEFGHEVLLDGEQEVRRVVGCDIHPVPVLDADLRGVNPPTIFIQNSNVANLNLGSQIGTINAAIQAISGGSDAQQREFVRALNQLTQAVLSEASLQAAQKQELVEALSTIAEQAAKKAEERSKGTLKGIVASLPTAISAAKNLADLWERLGPIIRAHLGI